MDTCVGLSSGTAGQLIYKDKTGTYYFCLICYTSKYLSYVSLYRCVSLVGRSEIDKNKIAQDSCACQCLPYMKTYREDLGICVDDVHGRYKIL